jgi:hypothetical protein
MMRRPLLSKSATQLERLAEDHGDRLETLVNIERELGYGSTHRAQRSRQAVRAAIRRLSGAESQKMRTPHQPIRRGPK